MDKHYKIVCNLILGAALVTTGMGSALAQDKVKVGLMLPYTGTFAALGNNITNGFKQYVEENGGKLAGREVQYVVVDDESNPARATEIARRLVTRDKVDVLIGSVHSGVALAAARVAANTKTLMIVPNAGANEITGAQCSPYVFRSSFSAWQPSYAMGEALAKRGVKNVVTLAWKYSFGTESVEGFTEGFTKGGGKIVKDMSLPFPNVEFQPFLTEIAALKPDAVFVFFAGAGAAKFVSDYAAAGLKGSIPLYGPGFLSEDVAAMGGAGEGLQTTLHYADGLNTERDNAFRTAYAAAYKAQPDVYAVQGYDAAQMYHAGLKAANGDPGKLDAVIDGIRAATIDSPRGSFTLSKAHNPVQDIYLREVKDGKNAVVEVVSAGLEDPARGCSM
ncbi:MULTISPECIES: ABC transporter substrate-binding protein [unclassified Thauera]|uniref:ABC transporter substrate-binding protein n=1 Tax=unclassified Thauera TaxID=2609274 RepID=UPI0002CDAD9E|nr:MULTISPECIES: ABC transporter substrate-binding protein [unclassified Thauera]ENO92266.1 extracellular ligand-binding receptor [Thauera sp. 28]WBL62492.1 ABC transporter substrate-binding protein [Thauera sp. WB-2]HNR61943.1 ABC transporter substrate-binding protein [Thauera sp.]HNS93562.1 ABC transporter substrate-binding protein [Thauera sp.]